MDLHQLYQGTPVADPTQADENNPNYYRSDHVETMDAWGMPKDMVLPVDQAQGVFVPATATPTNIAQYDPWTWAKPMKIEDHSIPEIGPYGAQDATQAKAGSIVAEWGGQPYPNRYFADQTYAVLQLPRRVLSSEGEAGRFYGPQQTAWQASTEAVPAQDDYWSTLILGASY